MTYSYRHMLSMARSFAVFAFVASTPVLAQGYDSSHVVRGLCQPDGCDDFAIIQSVPVATGEDGTLRRTTIKPIRSSESGRQEKQVENGYVYCSQTRPAILAQKVGLTMAYFIAPMSQQGKEFFRREASQHAVYFGACHGIEAGDRAAKDPASVAREFGYQVNLQEAQQVRLNSLDDILAPSGQPAIRGIPETPGFPADSELPPMSQGMDEPFVDQGVPFEDLPRSRGSLDDRLDQFLGDSPSRPSPNARRDRDAPDLPYDGPFEDDQWLAPRR